MKWDMPWISSIMPITYLVSPMIWSFQRYAIALYSWRFLSASFSVCKTLVAILSLTLGSQYSLVWIFPDTIFLLLFNLLILTKLHLLNESCYGIVILITQLSHKFELWLDNPCFGKLPPIRVPLCFSLIYVKHIPSLMFLPFSFLNK